MQIPLTIAEQLLYSTVMLTGYDNGNAVSTGTGFFMNFTYEDKSATVLLTNKHVIEGTTEVAIICHIAEADMPSGRFMSWTINNQSQFVLPHPTADVDLCALNFAHILAQAKEAGITLFFRHMDSSLIPTEEEWESFDAIENVTMIGYPRGISDEVNNLPIVRRGITASALSKHYNGKAEFMVDMACFPGSSGSPIFLLDNGYQNRENAFVIGTRLKLIGVLYAGPLVTNNGQLVLEQVPRVAVQSMMHLGNALRSTAILEIEAEIKRKGLA